MSRTTISRIARERARILRKSPTEAEKRLWRALRELNRIRPCRFRRQAPVGPYVADFACFTTKLVIEADGSQHAESARDRRRDRWFASRGLTTLRYWNTEIGENLPGVMASIDAAVQARTPGPTVGVVVRPPADGTENELKE